MLVLVVVVVVARIMLVNNGDGFDIVLLQVVMHDILVSCMI